MLWFMDDVETCRHDDWYGTYVKNGTLAPKPAPFDQDFYIVLNVVRGGRRGWVESRGRGAALDDEVMQMPHERACRVLEWFSLLRRLDPALLGWV